MTSAIQLSVLNGVGSEDLEQFWFVVVAVQEAHGVTDDNIKKATLVSALTWYMKYSRDHPNEGIEVIQEVLNKELGQPKSEAQSVIGFKEIVMLPGETPWDLDQRLKSTIREANMTLTDGQHCMWFVASLTPYLRTNLLQHKV